MTVQHVDWSYVAGYFDGEGHVGFHLVNVKSKGEIRTRSLQWINTHLGSLEAIRECIQTGRISKKSTQPGRKQCYLLTVTGKKNLLPVLDILIPLLLIKRQQAEELRGYLINNVKAQSEGFGKAAALTAEQLECWYHAEDKSLEQIAALVGVSVQAIWRVMKLRGVPRRPQGGRPDRPRAPRSEETKRRIGEANRRRWQERNC